MPTTTNFYATNDGGLEKNGMATWVGVHDASASNGAPTTYIPNAAYWRTVDSLYWISRGCADFDTDAIGAGSTITAASAFFYLNGIVRGTLERWYNIYSSNTAVPFTTDDYDQLGSTAYATGIQEDSIAAAYNEFVMNGTGIAAISKTGTTKIGTREATFDAANSAPTAQENTYCHFESSQYVGTDHDPYLAVTYTEEAAVNPTVSYSPTSSAGGGGVM